MADSDNPYEKVRKRWLNIVNYYAGLGDVSCVPSLRQVVEARLSGLKWLTFVETWLKGLHDYEPGNFKEYIRPKRARHFGG